MTVPVEEEKKEEVKEQTPAKTTNARGVRQTRKPAVNPKEKAQASKAISGQTRRQTRQQQASAQKRRVTPNKEVTEEDFAQENLG